MHRVAIVGGGFGGLYAAKKLRKAPVDLLLVDRRNFHLFQPLLYEVATGALSPGEIAAPLRAVLGRQENTRVLLGAVVDLNADERWLALDDGTRHFYDSLIVAAGAQNFYYGHDEWARVAPGLKSIEDATHIRHKIYYAFEAAERETDPEARRAWLTFVIVGGGPPASSWPAPSARSPTMCCAPSSAPSGRARRRSSSSKARTVFWEPSTRNFRRPPSARWSGWVSAHGPEFA